MIHTNLHCRVITSQRVIYDREVEAVVVPASDGLLGVLPRHMPMLALLRPGAMQVRLEGKLQRLVIDGGVAQVFHHHVSVLTERAVAVRKLTFDAITEAEQQLAVRAEEASADQVALLRERSWYQLCRRILEEEQQ